MLAPSLQPPTDILDLTDWLVSPFTGIVRKLHAVRKDVSEPPSPFVWRAEVSNHLFSERDDKMMVAAGKGLDEKDAIRSALGEAVERYCAMRCPPSGCRLAARSELEGAVLDPNMLVLHSAEQLETLPYAAYSPDLPIAWVEGVRLGDRAPAWIPAQAVYLLPPRGSPIFFQPTSNGLAAGATAENAQLRSLLELVERDSFLAAWYHRLELRRIDVDTHPDRRVPGLADAYRRRGVEIELYLAPSDHRIPVVIALAVEQSEGGVAAVVGLGADLLLSRAVRSALMEVGQVRPATRMRLRDPKVLERREKLVAEPNLVAELEDHDLLYTDHRMLHAFDHWRCADREPMKIEDDPVDDDRALDMVVERLRSIGAEAFACDVTTPDIASLGLHVWRALIEDFQPIHFGEAEFRAGGKRFYEVPVRLGLRKGPASRADLNPLPHPLA